MYDVIVIGSGPAGYTAGVYAVRAGLNVLILEGQWGGQLMTTTVVENYPGFPNGVEGFDLMENMRTQCHNQGCKLVAEKATHVQFDKTHTITANGIEYETKTIVIATGAYAKTLDIPGHKKYWNKGISACAVCDGALPMFRKKNLAVVGGGDTACEEALFLSRFGSKVYMIVRKDKMRASQSMIDKVNKCDNIQILFNSEVSEAKGDEFLKHIVVKGENIEVRGLFYAIGHTPSTELFDTLDKDDNGYLITKDTKTNVPGVFACGDVQDKVYRQAITAAGSGCAAALEANWYIQNMVNEKQT